jgi:glycosyltransferase involved in cell wall biosynthesis
VITPLDPLARILILVPHEPSQDPRVGWVADLCRQIGRTDVLGATWSTEHQAREFDGTVYLERVNIAESASPAALARAARRARLGVRGPAQRYVAAEGRRRGAGPGWNGLRTHVDHQAGAALRHLGNSASHALLSDALYRRGRALSIPPRVIVCHDIFALAAGVKLKRQFGSRLLYDTHEFWPEADLISQRWEQRLVEQRERGLIREADTVITVTPGLARHLEGLYGLPEVLSVPNAAPFEPAVLPSPQRPPGSPVRFLIQGRVAPRRGYEELLAAWRQVDDPRAVLMLRCPPDPYLSALTTRFADLVDQRRLLLLEPVDESDLISAATDADVGVIAYPAETMAHLFACPNKLSQFMHAGLAILTNQLPYVQEVVARSDCGLVFDINDPRSLLDAVMKLVDDPQLLSRMKANARHGGREWFNWERQSGPYRDALERLFGRVAV